MDDEEAEIADAFEAEVQQIVDQAKLLAGASCDRLVLATEQDPTSLATLRSFALTLKDLATREDALARSSTQSLVRVMEQSLTALDQTLVSCKIDTRPSEAQFAEYDWV